MLSLNSHFYFDLLLRDAILYKLLTKVTGNFRDAIFLIIAACMYARLGPVVAPSQALIFGTCQWRIIFGTYQ